MLRRKCDCNYLIVYKVVLLTKLSLKQKKTVIKIGSIHGYRPIYLTKKTILLDFGLSHASGTLVCNFEIRVCGLKVLTTRTEYNFPCNHMKNAQDKYNHQTAAWLAQFVGYQTVEGMR